MDTARPDLGLGVFQVTDEAPHAMTAWEIHEVRSEQSLIGGATTRIVENGPLYAALEVVHQVHSSTITETIRFYRDLPRVDFEARIEWNEVGNASDGVPGLKVAFTGSMPECEAWFETPFGAAQRPSNGQEVPALRWADVGGGKYGFAVLNDSKHGYDALGCRLRLTLLRSAYDPDAISDTGSHVVRFAFLPHPGNWRDAGVVASAAAFNVPFLVAPGAYDEMRQDDEDEDEADEVDEGAAGISVRLADAGTAVISSIKPARWGAGQVAIRIYETGGREVHGAALVVDNLRAAWHASIVEEPGAQIEAVGDSIEVTLKPWEVRTYLVEYEPEYLDDEDWDDDWDDEDEEDDEEEED
jgi:alpha-mannosidase